MDNDIGEEPYLWTNNMFIQHKSYLVTGGAHKINIHRGNMKEKIKSDVKIGDVVELINRTAHNSKAPGYVTDIIFSSEEIGNFIQILDIGMCPFGDLYYKVNCNKGITYIRRTAFKPVSTAPQPKEDLSYLISLLKDLQ